ncbi:MAG: transporter [Herminiimonas sp.]|nr:transporter [Herminiimonas sp.]
MARRDAAVNAWKYRTRRIAGGIGLCFVCMQGTADDGAERGPADPVATSGVLQFDSGLQRRLSTPDAPPAVREHEGHGGGHAASQPASAASEPAFDTQARVVSVDRKSGQALLEHGPIPRLNMPAMTMMFKAKNADVLQQLRAGERVGIRLEAQGSQLVVTAVSSAKAAAGSR